MRKKIRQQYDIEFTPEELHVLARASKIMEEVTSSAIDGVVGFEVKSVPSTLNCTRYTVKEICNCMGMLEDLCNPFGKLEGYFDKYDSK